MGVECNLTDEHNQMQQSASHRKNTSMSNKKMSTSQLLVDQDIQEDDALPSKHQPKSEIKPVDAQNADNAQKKVAELTPEEYN